MKTHQQIFSTTLKHLRKQGKPSMRVRKSDECAYRGKDGAMCALGVHILDQFYHSKLESAGMRAKGVLSALTLSGVDATDTKTCNLLHALQRAHDVSLAVHGTMSWENRMAAIAGDFGLKYRKPKGA